MVLENSIFSSSQNLTKVAVTSGAALLGGYVIYKGSQWLLQPKFSHAGTVEKIFVYPVKSLKGIQINEAEATSKGIKYGKLRDREFMVIDAQNKFVTMRSEPTLAGIKASYDLKNPDFFTLSAEGLPDLKIDLEQPQNIPESSYICIDLWRTDYYVTEVSPLASAWFSDYLKKPGHRFVRVAKPKDPKTPYSHHLHDRTSFHILGTASVEDISKRVVEKYKNSSDKIMDITERNFRPSIYIKTTQPYIEDQWKHIKIGDAMIRFFERCDRCVMTTVDQDKMIRTDTEPLKTLREFRVDRSDVGKKLYKFAPLFGTKSILVPGHQGKVRVGDEVTAQFTKDPLIVLPPTDPNFLCKLAGVFKSG